MLLVVDVRAGFCVVGVGGVVGVVGVACVVGVVGVVGVDMLPCNFHAVAMQKNNSHELRYDDSEKLTSFQACNA